MKRLLCIVSAMDAGGAETFLMKIYRTINRSKYQMDFCVNSDSNLYAEEIEYMGGKIYKVPIKSKHPVASFRAIKELVREQNFDYVIRVNEHSLSTIDLIAAKCGGANNLIMRSSNACSGGRLRILLHKIFRCLPNKIPTVKFAPSTEAAEYTFGKGCVEKGEVFLLHNGLNLGNFAFSLKKRNSIRAQFGLEDKFVIGHVGRFVLQKNHKFIIQIFAEVVKKNKNAILILIGDGPLKNEIRGMATGFGLQDNIIYLGVRSDVNELLNVFDCFLFPSFYEGMPNTVIEAQTNGLFCLISDTITKEVEVTGQVKMLSLHEPPTKWAVELMKGANTLFSRESAVFEMRDRGYDIKDCADVFVKKIFEGEK